MAGHWWARALSAESRHRPKKRLRFTLTSRSLCWERRVGICVHLPVGFGAGSGRLSLPERRCIDMQSHGDGVVVIVPTVWLCTRMPDGIALRKLELRTPSPILNRTL